jgi:hypothetical protein
MKGFEDCGCGSKETYTSFAGDVCCYPCFIPLVRVVVKAVDTTAKVSKDPGGWSVKVGGKLKRYFSKYEDYAYTDAVRYARGINNKGE